MLKPGEELKVLELGGGIIGVRTKRRSSRCYKEEEEL